MASSKVDLVFGNAIYLPGDLTSPQHREIKVHKLNRKQQGLLPNFVYHSLVYQNPDSCTRNMKCAPIRESQCAFVVQRIARHPPHCFTEPLFPHTRASKPLLRLNNAYNFLRPYLKSQEWKSGP